MNRKRTLIIILILFTGLFPLLPIPIAKATEATVSIQESEDDVWMTESGNIFGYEASVRILEPEIGIRSFLRFEDVPLLKSSKINLATLNVYAGFDQGETISPGAKVTIYGIDEPDCAPFSYSGQVWSLERPYTSAYVNWNVSDWHYSTWKSVNVTSIVKEIINQYAWEQNNSIGFQIIGASDSGYEYRTFEDIDHQHHGAYAYLHFHYDVIDEEDPPEDEYDLVEQYGPYTVWHDNGTGEEGWLYSINHTIDGSTAGAQTDYQVNITTYFNIPEYVEFASNGVAQPLNWVNMPSAVYYNGRTYIVWGGGDNTCDPYIIAYNHTDDTWSGIVKVAENPLASDDHGAPDLAINGTGYIHVFYGSHLTAQKHAISDNPEDITAWTVQANPTAEATYPKLIVYGSDIYLFYRQTVAANHLDESYRIFDGAVWGAETKIIDQGADTSIYMGNVERVGTLIHMAWTLLDQPSDRRDIYYAYLNTADGHMYSVDGTDLGADISDAEATANCLVVDTGAFDTNSPSMHIDGSGNPHIIYLIETGTGWDFRYIYWTGLAWSASQSITTDVDDQWDHSVFNINSPTDIDAYLSTTGIIGSTGGDIQKWSYNGSSWALAEVVLTEAESGRALNLGVIPLNFLSDLELVFCQVIVGDYATTDLKLYAYGSDFTQNNSEDIGLDGKCREDFGDIRFFQGLTELDYWMELHQNNSYADFWVEVANIPASPDTTTINILYGNPDVTTTSNHTATMIRADDGVSGNFDEDTKGTATLTHTGGYYVSTENTADDAFVSGMNMTDWGWMSYIRIFETFATVSGGGRSFFGVWDEDDVDDMCGLTANVNPKQRFQILRRSTSEANGDSIAVIYFDAVDDNFFWDGDSWDPAPQLHATTGDLELRIWSNGTSIFGDVFSSGASIFDAEASVAISSVKNFSSGRLLTWSEPFTEAYTLPQDIDRYFTRKLASVEPTHGGWGEEENVTLDYYFITDENGTVISTNGNFTDLDDLEDWIDDNLLNGGDPLDPDPGTQGWDTEGPFTRFRMRLYFLIIGLGCIFGPLWAMGYKKMDSIGYAWCALLMILGTGLLWSIVGI